MTGNNNHLYVIYYGSFTSLQTDIIDTFLENVGGSGAYGVNTTYYDVVNNQQTNISNVLSYRRASDSYYDSYSLGKSVKGRSVETEIQNVLAAGHLPTDDNGIYILVTSPDVGVTSGFCGYHNYSTSIAPGHTIKYAFSPDPSGSALAGCSGNVATFGDTTSPNGDIGADSVTDTLIHEISETVTDPQISAWYTKGGAEVGDLCNFIYGTTFLAANGSHANQTFGSRSYLVQTIWLNVGAGSCANHYP
jgi:hypothetical protein